MLGLTFIMITVYDTILDPKVADSLHEGKIGVIKTDTLYGIVAQANDEIAVKKIFSAKKRSPDKPVLVLIADTSSMFDPYDTTPFMDTFWPGKNTIILPSPSAPTWVTRGTQTVAYRIPAESDLYTLLQLTGPLVAPSANPEGETPAMNIQEAIAYFGDAVDFYVDGGEVLETTPSQLLRPNPDGTMTRLR